MSASEELSGLASTPERIAAHAEMLGNRLRKRLRHLRKWASRQNISCYRIYDRDIPEIPLTIDWYDGHLHIARFLREDTGGEAWLDAMAEVAAELAGVPYSRVYCKDRQRQRGTAQYQRMAERERYLTVREGGHRFAVNLSDYLDTGLFLDHRLTRALVKRDIEAQAAQGGQSIRFLNLFCYTASFTVYAAAGGARHTVSVDLSNAYLDWAQRNFDLNDMRGSDHRLVRADVLAYLREPPPRPLFDLAVLDPPTFSNSKKMLGVLDTQRDHAELINRTLTRLREGGTLYFSTNYRRFVLDEQALDAAEIEDISAATMPEDFRDQRIHRCFRLRK